MTVKYHVEVASNVSWTVAVTATLTALSTANVSVPEVLAAAVIVAAVDSAAVATVILRTQVAVARVLAVGLAVCVTWSDLVSEGWVVVVWRSLTVNASVAVQKLVRLPC